MEQKIDKQVPEPEGLNFCDIVNYTSMMILIPIDM